MIFFRKKQLDPPVALPDLARDIYEKKDADEKAAAVLDGTMNASDKLFDEKQIKEPTATPPSMYSPHVQQVQQPLQQTQQQAIQPVQQFTPYPMYPQGYPQAYPQPYLQPYPMSYPFAMSYPTMLPWHGPQHIATQLTQQQTAPVVQQSSRSSPPQQGFFHAVEHAFLRGEKPVQNTVDDMKQFYTQTSPKDEGKYLQASITRTLAELKDLERIWRETKESLEAMEQDCLEKEREIEHKATELKLFLEHVKKRIPVKVISQEHWFRCHSGESFASILALKEAIPGMSDGAFAHHVADGRNDFASWVRDVFAEPELADRMLHAKSKAELYALLDAVI